MNLIRLLQSKINLLILVSLSLTFFSIGFYVLKYFPSSTDLTCSVGSYFNPINLSYIGLMSVLFAWILTGFKFLISQKIKIQTNYSLLSLIGLIFTALTTVCTICTLPLISLAGLSFSLAIFTQFSWPLKIIALLLACSSLYLLEMQLQKKCILNNCKL